LIEKLLISMKKIFVLLSFLISSLVASAQVEIGVQFSPSLSTTRFESKTEEFKFDNYKAGIRFNTGIVADIFIRDNIAFSTGIWYSVKRSGISATDTTSSPTTINSVTNTQYLNLPLSFKLYTQEIIPRVRLYLQVGGIADVKISKDKVKLDGKDLVNPETFSKVINTSLLVSIGTDIKIGSHNKFFAAIYYNRGLINMLTKDYSTTLNSTNLALNSDQSGFTVGYKF
jgi:hypothetical protein